MLALTKADGATRDRLASLAAAMLAAPLIRAATAELNRSIGTLFPFSLAHCRTAARPGCGQAGGCRLAAGSATG